MTILDTQKMFRNNIKLCQFNFFQYNLIDFKGATNTFPFNHTPHSRKGLSCLLLNIRNSPVLSHEAHLYCVSLRVDWIYPVAGSIFCWPLLLFVNCYYHSFEQWSGDHITRKTLLCGEMWTLWWLALNWVTPGQCMASDQLLILTTGKLRSRDGPNPPSFR